MGNTTVITGKLKSNKRIEGQAYDRIMNLHQNPETPYSLKDQITWNGLCQWIVSSDRLGIEWDQEEKFKSYIEWLELIIKYALDPFGYVLSGKLLCVGAEKGDIGSISVQNNEVSFHQFDKQELADYYKEENIALQESLGKIDHIAKGVQIWVHNLNTPLKNVHNTYDNLYFIINNRPDGTNYLYGLYPEELHYDKPCLLDIKDAMYTDLEHVTAISTYPRGLYERLFRLPQVLTIELINPKTLKKDHMHIHIPQTALGRRLLEELYRITNIKEPVENGYGRLAKFIFLKFCVTWLMTLIIIGSIAGIITAVITLNIVGLLPAIIASTLLYRVSRWLYRRVNYKMLIKHT